MAFNYKRIAINEEHNLKIEIDPGSYVKDCSVEAQGKTLRFHPSGQARTLVVSEPSTKVEYTFRYNGLDSTDDNAIIRKLIIPLLTVISLNTMTSV